MELCEEKEALISTLKAQLESDEVRPDQKMSLLNEGLTELLNSAALQTDDRALSQVKSQLYHSGILHQCIRVIAQHPNWLRGNWSAAASLAHLTSSCCVGAELSSLSEAFHRLFLPSVMDSLLLLASQLMSRVECVSVFRKLLDSVGWLLSTHTQLTDQVLSSNHYEEIQMSDDAAVSLLCIQMWIQICTVNRNFLSDLSNDSALLLLNEAVGQLALSSDLSVGGATIRLMLLMGRTEPRLRPLLLCFKGLDRLLEKDWRGRGFDQEVDELIAVIQSEKRGSGQSEVSSEHVRAACLIQAAWRSYRTRQRVKNLNRAVSVLQRRYRARRRRQQLQEETQKWEEELRYQVCVRRQQARRRFHQKQRQLLQLLPADQVQSYLQECERRAAVLIQSCWRGFRERRRYNETLRVSLKEAQRRHEAARKLQRAARRFLLKRRAAQAPPLTSFWIGQEGLTESRRAELKQEVEQYIAAHRSTRTSPEECAALHQEVQLLLWAELQKGAEQKKEEQRVEALLAHMHTNLELMREAPPLSAVTAAQAEAFCSPSASIAARARDAHNERLQTSRLPWWRRLGEVELSCHTHQLEAGLEAGLGGLFIGGSSAEKHTEVDRANL